MIFLSPVLPSPRCGGREMRAFNWLTELNKTHDIILIIIGPASPIDDEVLELIAWADFISSTNLLKNKIYRLLGLCMPFLTLISSSFLFNGRHISSDHQVLKRLASQFSKKRPSLLLVFRLDLHPSALILKSVTAPLRVEIDYDDWEFQCHQSLMMAALKLKLLFRAILLFSQSLQYLCCERRIMKAYDKTFLASATDAEYFKSFNATVFKNRLSYVPKPACTVTEKERFNILFVGTLNYLPNIDAVKNVLIPLASILHRHFESRVQITIAGRSPESSLAEAISKLPNMVMKVNPPVLDEIYNRTDVVVVPIRYGGGSKIKTIEALAHGKTVIGNTESLRCLKLGNEDRFIKAKSPQDYFEAIKAEVIDKLGEESFISLMPASKEPCFYGVNNEQAHTLYKKFKRKVNKAKLGWLYKYKDLGEKDLSVIFRQENLDYAFTMKNASTECSSYFRSLKFNTTRNIEHNLHLIWFTNKTCKSDIEILFEEHNPYIKNNIQKTSDWHKFFWTIYPEQLPKQMANYLNGSGVIVKSVLEIPQIIDDAKKRNRISTEDEKHYKELCRLIYFFVENSDFGTATDIARYLVVFLYGGVYVDGDYRIDDIETIEKMMAVNDSFFGIERHWDVRLGNAFIASIKYGKVIHKALELSHRNSNVFLPSCNVPKYIRYPFQWDMGVICRTGPVALTVAFAHCREKERARALEYGSIFRLNTDLSSKDKNQIGKHDFAVSWMKR